MKVQFISEYEDSTFVFNHCIKTEQMQQDYHPHYHDLYEIVFVKDGDISYLTEETTCPVHKNSLILTRPRQQHCIRIDKNTPYDRYNLLFSSNEMCMNFLGKLPENLSVVCCDSNSLVVQLFEKMDFYCEKLGGGELGKILRTLTEEILLNIHLQLSEASEKSLAAKHPITLSAIAYIEDHLTTLAGVEPICRHLGVSRTYLYQIFQSDLEITPKRYIMERRLNLARQEIFLGAKATAVYTQCGFSDYSTFFRAYKKHFGYPPTGTQHASFVRNSNKDFFLGYTE